MDTNKITIAICTRNREKDLYNCISSISKQNAQDYINKIIIVDDAKLSPAYLQNAKDVLKGYNLQYHKKDKPGLFLSRLKAIQLTESDIILFLDDDVTIEKNYLKTLFTTYKKYPNLIGIGGLDLLLSQPSFIKSLYETLFLFKSSSPGKLSITGFNSSMNTWIKKQQNFETEFLNGCNMSFKTSSLLDLSKVKFFNNYSLGEDLFISLHAQEKGKMIIMPSLLVKHHHTSTSRDDVKSVSSMKIINHFSLLAYTNTNHIKYYFIYLSFIGMMLGALLKLDFKQIKGYFRGIVHILKNYKNLRKKQI